MIVAWALIVRRAWFRPPTDFHASHRPVSAANTDTAAPRYVIVPACHSSRAQMRSLPPDRRYDIEDGGEDVAGDWEVGQRRVQTVCLTHPRSP